MIFLDFAKAFDTVPYERLPLTGKFYGISGKLNNWLRVFLTGRRKRVVLNSSSPNWSTVLSSVPQGKVLGSILVLLFINHLPLPNADDSVLYRHIVCSADHGTLQQDLLRLE